MPSSPPDFAALSLAEIAEAVAEDRLPPVDRWHPAHCGDSEMRIARDGTWFHQGAPIRRAAMVRAFSRLLRRESDGTTVLVTPVEKLTIEMEDAAFVAVELKAEHAGKDARLAFRLNTDDVVVAGPRHPIRVADTADGPRPYLLVRPGLEALIARTVFYDLAERAIVEEGQTGVWSNGAFFPLEPQA